MLVGNITSIADYERKNADLKKLLRLRASLNEKSEIASNIGENIYRGEMFPAPQAFQSLEEKISNTNVQRNLAIDSLKMKVGMNNAANFVNTYLASLEALLEFNDHWDDFSEMVLPGMIPSHIAQSWQQYKGLRFATEDNRATLDRGVQDQVDAVGRGILDMVPDMKEYHKVEKVVMDATRRHDLGTLSELVYGLRRKWK